MSLSISQKLKGLIGFLIAILVIGTVVGYWGVSYTIQSYHDLLSRNVEQAKAGMQAQVSYGLSVRAFKNYLVRKDPKYIDEFNKALADVKEQMKKYESLAETQEAKAEIKKAWDSIGPFEKAFQGMVEARNKSNDIVAVDKLFGRPAQPVYEAVVNLDELAQMSWLAKQKEIDSKMGILKLAMVIGVLIACAIVIILAGIFVKSIINPIITVRNVAMKVADRDLSDNITVNSRDELGEMAEGFNKMMESLRFVIGKINDTTNSAASSSEELSATVQQIARRTEEQAERTNQVATASTQMAQTVIDVAKNTANIASSANVTLKTAQQGADVVSRTVNEVQEIAQTVSELAQGMVSLGERSKQIGDIVGVIKDIADQTNLLALNAAIEAARAGEQGRGFAVVADEVRKLAEKTTNSTAQIGEMITAIQVEMERAVQSMDVGSSKVETGVHLATEAGESLQEIVRSVNELQAMVQQIASATEEMSAVSEHISSDIEIVASVSRETSASSTEISQAVDNIARLSAELKGEAGRFRLK